MFKKGKYKQWGSIKCPPHMTKKELKDWWIGHHSITGRLIPNLLFYTVNFPLDNTVLNDPPFDGFADNSFASLKLLKRGGTSKEMEFQINDVKKYRLDDPSLCQIVWVEEYIVDIQKDIENPPDKNIWYKQLRIFKRPVSLSKKQLRDLWLDKFVKSSKDLPGMRWHTVNFTLENTPFGVPVFDGYEEQWFKDLENMKKAFNSSSSRKLMEDLEEHGLSYPGLVKVVWAETNIIEIPKNKKGE